MSKKKRLFPMVWYELVDTQNISDDINGEVHIRQKTFQRAELFTTLCRLKFPYIITSKGFN